MAWNDATLPAGWVTITTINDGAMFLDTDSLMFTLSASTATSYEVRDYYGAIVATGTVSGLSLTLAARPLGWYSLYLRRVTSVATYGTLIGRSAFCVMAADARLLSPPPVMDANAFGNFSDSFADHAPRGVAVLGPYRAEIDNADAPTTGILTIAKDLSDQAWLDDYYVDAIPDSVRPRPTFLLFPNGTWQTGSHPIGVTTTVAALYPSIEYFEGPINEPDLVDTATWVTRMQTFYNAVKAANASAKVIGPAAVSINGAMLDRLDAFFAAGGGDYLDSISFHAYNCTNWDITLGRRTMDAFTAMLASHGLDDKELWQTECGTFAADFGVFDPRKQARGWMMQRFILDQYGVPKERDYWFYDHAHGFWDYASFWKLPDGSLTPMIAMTRVYSQELYGKTWDSALDFGEIENDHYIGSRFEAASGAAVLALLSGGRTDGGVTLQVTGAVSLTVAGTFGTTSTVTCDSWGRAAIAVGTDPVYVRVPVDVTATVVPKTYGVNIATWGITPTAGNDSEATKIFDTYLENQYYLGDEWTRPEYRDDTALPATVTGTLERPRRIDTVIVHCPAPHQEQGTLLDYDLEYQDADGDWTVLETVTEPAAVVAAANDSTGTRCFVDSFHSGRCIFVHEFEPVVAAAIRLTVRDTTYGGVPDAAAFAAGGQSGAHKIRLRRISVHCRDTTIPRVLGPAA